MFSESAFSIPQKTREIRKPQAAERVAELIALPDEVSVAREMFVLPEEDEPIRKHVIRINELLDDFAEQKNDARAQYATLLYAKTLLREEKEISANQLKGAQGESAQRWSEQLQTVERALAHLEPALIALEKFTGILQQKLEQDAVVIGAIERNAKQISALKAQLAKLEQEREILLKNAPNIDEKFSSTVERRPKKPEPILKIA